MRNFTLGLVVALALVPFALADHGASSCSEGIGAVSSSCAFVCHEGSPLSASTTGLAYVTASCGGASTCNFDSICAPAVANYDGSGTCSVIGYVWLEFRCSGGW